MRNKDYYTKLETILTLALTALNHGHDAPLIVFPDTLAAQLAPHLARELEADPLVAAAIAVADAAVDHTGKGRYYVVPAAEMRELKDVVRKRREPPRRW